MSEDHKKTLQSQLWNIANTLRGKMGADEFRDYIPGFTSAESVYWTDGIKESLEKLKTELKAEQN